MNDCHAAEDWLAASTAEEYSRLRRGQDPRIARRAACLTKYGHPDRARRLLTCAPIELGGYPCHERVLCPQCRKVWCWHVAESWKCAALYALNENPETLLYKTTLTCGTFGDWHTGFTFLRWMLTASARWTGSWSKVDGHAYMIEFVRRGVSRYYVHLHGIMALDRRDMPTHPRTLARRWARRVVRRRIACGFDREPQDLCAAVDLQSKHVTIEPLVAYKTSGYLQIAEPLPSADELGSRVAAFAMYAGDETKEAEHAVDKVRFAYPLRIDDEVEIALRRIRLHGTTGILAAPRNEDNSA